MSADAKLKAYIDRILRCREAEDLAKEDTKSVYAELAGEGYEKSVVGQVVTFLRKREKDSDKVAEQSAKFNLYLEAYERPSHAHAREGAVSRTEITTASQGEAEDHSDERVTDRKAAEDRVGANAGGEDVDGGAVRADHCDQENIEPSGPEAERATNSPETAIDPPAFLTKTPSPLRPHCQRPEMCAGVGRNHCGACTKAMREQEEMA